MQDYQDHIKYEDEKEDLDFDQLFEEIKERAKQTQTQNK